MRLRTAVMVERRPSRRTLFQTSRTRSGRVRAFCRRFFRANSEEARSVPTETNEAAVRTRTHPGSNLGAGTSTTSTSPPLTCWRSCFIFWWATLGDDGLPQTLLYDGRLWTLRFGVVSGSLTVIV